MRQLSLALKNAFFELLRSGLWSTKPDAILFEHFTPDDWNRLYTLVKEQAVIGVCYPALEKLPVSVRPPRTLYLTWYAQVEFIKENNRHMREVYAELIDRFNEQDFYPMLLKGLGVGTWYPEPELRMTGDIDLFFPAKYDKAVALVESWGFEVTYMSQHDKFYYKGILIEMHHSIISPASLELDIMPVYTEAGQEQYRIPDEDSYAFLLLVHAVKHLVASGVGVRHLCDWALFLFHNHTLIDCELVWKNIRSLGIKRFVIEFTELSVDYLGLDPQIAYPWIKEGAKEKYKKRLAEELLKKGDFGKFAEKRQQMDTHLFSFVMIWDSICFYKCVLIQYINFYPYWPSRVLKLFRHMLLRRFKLILQGKPLAINK